MTLHTLFTAFGKEGQVHLPFFAQDAAQKKGPIECGGFCHLCRRTKDVAAANTPTTPLVPRPDGTTRVTPTAERRGQPGLLDWHYIATTAGHAQPQGGVYQRRRRTKSSSKAIRQQPLRFFRLIDDWIARWITLVSMLL